jgi:hypothetical protein
MSNVSKGQLETPDMSVVLCAMGRLELAAYGFRSWMIQDADRPYQIIMCLFNDQRELFERLTVGKNPHCQVEIHTFDRPSFFNISASNNLGLHFARGRYVTFANSDIIYPRHYIRRSAAGMIANHLYYATGTRANLTLAHTKALRPPETYTAEDSFDFLDRDSDAMELEVWPGFSPWIIERELVLKLGGYDPKVLVIEDRDLEDRAMHYLRRHKMQDCIYAMINLVGYHLYHPTSELFINYIDSRVIIDRRRAAMAADPNGADDIIENHLDSLPELIEEVRRTQKPPPLKKYRQNFVKKVISRFHKAGKVLIGRR